MTTNDNFNAALEKSGLSMYALAKCSGVPYTTINEIHNSKNDINKCPAATVWRLAAALGVSADEIVNEINYLDGIHGKYKGIHYTWSTNKNSVISFEHDGELVTLDAGAFYNIPSRIRYYNIIAGWMIQHYLEQEEWKAKAREIFEEKKGNPHD